MMTIYATEKKKRKKRDEGGPSSLPSPSEGAGVAPSPSSRRLRRSSPSRPRLPLLPCCLLALLLLFPTLTSAKTERELLDQFYKSLSGPNWSDNDGWNDGNTPVCSWHGVTCSGSSKQSDEGVTELYLEYNNLAGKIPKSFWHLPKLQYVSLKGNSIASGNFEGITTGQNSAPIVELKLNENSLTDLYGIDEFPNTLERLHLTSNRLQGTFPKELLELRSLKHLWLSFNPDLTGTLPTSIGYLDNLRELYLYGTSFSKTIPTEIGWLDKLEIATFAENKFTGTIPYEVKDMVNLRTFSVHNNEDGSGTLTGALPNFKRSVNLEELYLGGNELDRNIPRDFLKYSNRTDVKSSVVIGLEHNKLTGTIPTELGKFANLVINLEGNQISDLPDFLCEDKTDPNFRGAWMGGLVDQYYCDAILCRRGSVSDTGKATGDGDGESCRFCPDGVADSPYLGGTACKSDEDDLTGEDFDYVPDLEALSRLYLTLNGHKWSNKDGWDILDEYFQRGGLEYITERHETGADGGRLDVCDWYGVTCNDNDEVKKLELRNQNLNGQIPDSLWRMTALTSLDVSRNRVSVDEDKGMDGPGWLDDLRVLKMSETDVDNLYGLSDADGLEELYLDSVYLNNDDNGIDELFELDTLRVLHLAWLELGGKLSHRIGELTELRRLNLQGNKFTGKVANGLGALQNLVRLDLSDNCFRGPISSVLTNLRTFRASPSPDCPDDANAGLTGALPSFANNPALRDLNLDGNKFQGPIPEDFLGGVPVANEDDEILVGLSHNDLTGSIPTKLARLVDLKIDLVENKIDDVDASILCRADSQWMDGVVATLGGSCDAILCPPQTYSVHGRATNGTDGACLDCPSLSDNYWGHTSCGSTGGVGTPDAAERDALLRLYKRTGGSDWEKGEKWREPGVPICEYQGVTCDSDVADPNRGVEALDLQSFGMRGTFPTEIYELPYLKRLTVEDNSVEFSFAGIENAGKMEYLQATNVLVYGLDGLEKATSTLKELHLSRNDMSGEIPTQIFALTDLEVLYLNYNQFSGEIPDDFLEMSSLTELWLYRNDFTGHIPTFLGDMTNMKNLILSENYLSGHIPTELGRMESLVFLGLANQKSQDKLTGPLFDFATNADLFEVDVKMNALTGTVPKTLMDGVDKSLAHRMQLSRNKFTGGIPVEFNDFDKLLIDLADNMISTLDPAICPDATKEWMKERMKTMGGSCDLILCPPDKYATFGFQVYEDEPCEDCPTGTVAPYYGSTECAAPKVDVAKIALSTVYNKLNGTNWVKQNNWMTKTDVCSWQGVKCDEDGNVVELRLENNNLGGKTSDGMSSLFWTMPNLVKLDLKGNNFKMDFTSADEATKLEVLKLSNTGLDSLDGIEGLKGTLKALHLTNNRMKGPFPPQLLALTNLEELYLSYNDMDGPLPTGIGKLSKLEYLYAYGNAFQGQIPTQVGDMYELKEFIMPSCAIGGSVPAEFGKLNKLEQLNLHEQKGGLLTGKLPSFKDSPRLWYLDLSSNALTGSIPADFMANNVWSDDHVTVALDSNQLTGTVPTGISQVFNKLNLQVADNLITKIPPGLCDATHDHWMQEKVGLIGTCNAILCEAGTYSDTGRQEFKDQECQACAALVGSPYLGQTKCASKGRERDILMELYEELDGDNWDQNDNWSSPSSPVCSFRGVYCDNGDQKGNSGVIGIDLTDNGLKGTLPPSVYQLESLKSLVLKENEDLYMTFENIQDAANLEVLYISEIDLDGIDGLWNAKALKRVHLTGNLLTGTIPDELYDNMGSLEELFIAYNSFSGTISPKIKELSNLRSLYAYDNELSGMLPTEFGELQKLSHVVFAENMLSGTLPTQLSTMPSLELFSAYRRYKSGPKLSGPLPHFSKNPRLTDLYLDYNFLTGTIPEKFLSASMSAKLITLSYNLLQGTVPAKLDDLESSPLEIQLEGNEIDALPDVFCDNEGWMGGFVSQYECNAILCPKHTASVFGRVNSTGSECVDCDDPDAAPYMGSTSCEVVLSEREILEIFFDAMGGNQWWNKENWMSKNHVCTWYGISCTSRKTVRGIRLGANNLVGTPPPELFDLPELQSVGLHSNPITFNFDNVGSARALFELRLDSTGIKSINGISAAVNLAILDLRFNDLAGPFPAEIFKLVNLKSLSLADNNLDGPLPNLQELKLLRTLRLGSNGFGGRLPPYDDLHRLTTLDLSDNKLTGPIPDDFLDLVSRTAKIEIDLSNNELTGVVPVELDRFEDLTIYLRVNQISGIPNELCDNQGWNGGDVGSYDCDAILCPPGTYNELGRQSFDENPCLNCDNKDELQFYGQLDCVKPGTVASAPSSAAAWPLVDGRAWLLAVQTVVVSIVFGCLTMTI